MVQDITEHSLSAPCAAAGRGVTAPTAHKWLGAIWLVVWRRTINAAKASFIVELFSLRR
ncbi:hypothetical protein ACS15_0298 [Ralstonia insidiosa]|uniref:Uncharacterized protein n=1 Tax=Ralstonia insidiosa TaxID=190721 RepID=A0AAC9FPG7_9RALS|nr:hypothetical protein ACS15_0298 [Ralstonia insidiosa]EPX96168.1 hypothetical protein C404_20125 [Ralstonia sp. AU12-08]